MARASETFSGGIPDVAPVTQPTILDPQAVGAADIDLDGKTDLVAASGYGKLAIHSGNGDGTFGGPQEVPLPGYGNPAFATFVVMKIADLNGDGHADIAIDDYYDSTLSILTNTAVGPPPVVTPPPTVPGGPMPLPPPITPPPSPIKGLSKLITTGAPSTRGTLIVGQATNPPTLSTVQTLVYTPASARAAAHRKPKPKPVTVASGRTTIATGHKSPLSVKLTTAGRALLRSRAGVKVRLTIVATGAARTHATTTRTVTLKRAARHH